MDDPQRREDDLAALRARLYRPDATAEDLRRYEAVVATTPVAVALEPDEAPAIEAPAADAPPRRRRLVIGGALVGVVLAGVAVVALSLQAASPTLIMRPVPTGAPAYTVSPEVPVELVRDDGGTQVFRGRGDGTASLASAGSLGSGFALRITLGANAPVRWSLRRVEIRLDGDQYVRVLGERTTRQLHGVAVAYRYDGTPPTSVRIEVPSGVPWDLEILPAR